MSRCVYGKIPRASLDAIGKLQTALSHIPVLVSRRSYLEIMKYRKSILENPHYRKSIDLQVDDLSINYRRNRQ